MHKYLLQTNIYAIIFHQYIKNLSKTKNIDIQTFAYLFQKDSILCKSIGFLQSLRIGC